MVAPHRLGKGVALLSVLAALAGCAAPVDPQRTPTEDRLYRIGKAYAQASHRLERAPKNFEEIRPNLEGPVSDDLLRSANDGEPFVIHWGVDFVRLPPGGKDPFTIAAYEKHGANGSRYVLRFPLSVVLLTDEEFKKAVFPPGHEPPK
jgi:hypothetical protein